MASRNAESAVVVGECGCSGPASVEMFWALRSGLPAPGQSVARSRSHRLQRAMRTWPRMGARR